MIWARGGAHSGVPLVYGTFPCDSSNIESIAFFELLNNRSAARGS